MDRQLFEARDCQPRERFGSGLAGRAVREIGLAEAREVATPIPTY